MDGGGTCFGKRSNVDYHLETEIRKLERILFIFEAMFKVLAEGKRTVVCVPISKLKF